MSSGGLHFPGKGSTPLRGAPGPEGAPVLKKASVDAGGLQVLRKYARSLGESHVLRKDSCPQETQLVSHPWNGSTFPGRTAGRALCP